MLKAEGGKEEGHGCGENKICCQLTSSRLKISQHIWGHPPVRIFIAGKTRSGFYFRESQAKVIPTEI